MAGSIAGAEVGFDGLNQTWVATLADWPLSVGALQNIAEHGKGSFPRWPQLMFRNLAFLAIVLTHGFRRLIPPY